MTFCEKIQHEINVVSKDELVFIMYLCLFIQQWSEVCAHAKCKFSYIRSQKIKKKHKFHDKMRCDMFIRF